MSELRVIQGPQDETAALEAEVRKHVSITSVDKVVDFLSNWGRRSSIWPMQFGLACCAIEMICAASARFDISRFGSELFRASPRQADLMIVSGTVTKRMIPMIVRLYNQMPEPKYVISMGACATSGGPFKEGYNVVSGIDEFIPVDVYITGCPPTPQALFAGLIELQKKIDKQHYRDVRWYRKDESDERAIPRLGPDLVDIRQLPAIKEALAEGKIQPAPAVLPEYMAAFPVYEPEPPEPEPAADEADDKKKKLAARKKKAVEPPTVTPIMQKLLEQFPEVRVTTVSSLLVPAQRLQNVVFSLRDQGYTYLANLTSVDCQDCFEVVYHFTSPDQTSAEKPPVVLAVRTDKEKPSVPSLTPFWPGADFQEREVYDMMGIRFEGHPHLRRILMWEGYEGWPLRKDFLEPYYEEPVKIFSSRWREGHHDFAENRNIWGRNVRYPEHWDPETFPWQDDDPVLSAISPDSDLRTDLVEVNMGPQHPSTHGVFRMKLALDGEKIVRLYPMMGYLHRNHEKIGERNAWVMNIPYTDRLDYITSMVNNHGYVLAVEKLTGMEVPERAEYLRVIMSELTRIASHLWAQGFLLNDLGAFFTPMLYAAQERELILDLFEMTSGSRIMCNYMRFGGVSHDLPEEFYQPFNHLINERLPRMIDELDKFLTTNEIVMERTQGLGVLSAEDAIAYSCSGPVLRGSGVPFDLRRNQPYSIYDRFDFNVITQPKGDVYSRYLVRLGELHESLKILRQAIKDLPEGEIISKKQWNMRVPAGHAYAAVESPKGQLGYYVVSDGKTNPYRYHIRSGSFINLTALEKMSRGHMVADVVVILGSLDIVLGEVDR
ncbi:NADH-quinone oxidoreductase subunit NuoD [bacterium (Candidatus Blackallbacteria) CG17_big_fil_post_rev_8_21_14_2_50_48_46]|uniref:Multifunctional fusion protein n=1 Tax=bacterium (Candidatus Blackallbacteria) CG17_big_fil_post_rev_8_21_14_2_50_48_46 TaxID=2014261 RepID=A0A2M7G5E8_9BACT|nr:MAG: NADH-quinone oxidoreductase subunit NuoD [bacterium (Candidatus Blackallbacteria) CG18_big_fil_WC_8_21_14_2_50_49_26]PIW17137.1 MAG: NADH-quinone oxidoreductase subunit NuoD [bacterium (Candidatus Blackallbacteria) CG17_big_fil_post_rev_8_21_14_2_50_48_46]PIW47831.1 MAG: NADH-quinone oxidoreductase subunit NuoD [bacterium (Candidatus Blackallbacteria) CG13_big_fil_rev_8_21_14_2_50_49_14]